MMKKRVFTILMTAVLAFTCAAGPVCYAAASEGATNEVAEEEEENILDEAVDGVDKDSIRKSIREALQQMDEMGISPSAVAENVLGIRTTYKSNEKAPENTLIRDAQHEVQKRTEGFFTVLWNGFLDTIEKMITTGISVFGSGDGNVAKGGAAK